MPVSIGLLVRRLEGSKFKDCYKLTHSARYMGPSGTCAVVFALDISLPWQIIRKYDIKLCSDSLP